MDETLSITGRKTFGLREDFPEFHVISKITYLAPLGCH